MSLLETYPTQLEWIQQIQTIMRSYWADLFFMGWVYVDTIYFSILLISVVWYLVSREIGIKLLYILLLNGMVNALAKGYFALPRPCQLDAYVGLYCPNSYGFPSGAAQTAILLAGVVFIETKSLVFRRFSILFAAFFCFSRVYLGVHYPTDIVGGLVIGFLLVIVYWKVFPLFKKRWKWAIFILPILAVFIQWPTTLGNAMGVAVGLLAFESSGWKWPRPSIRFAQCLSVLVGVAICFFLMGYLPSSWTVPVSFIRGFWLSFLGGWWVYKLASK